MTTSNLPIFLINLQSSTERLDQSDEQLSSLGLKYQRVDAIDYSKDVITEADFVTKDIRAIWLSHLKALEMFLETGISYALILEDDFRILRRNSFLDDLEKIDFEKWDLIQIGYLNTGLDIRIRIIFENLQNRFFSILGKFSHVSFLSLMNLDSRLRVKDTRIAPRGYIPFSFLPGAHSYIISREMAGAVLKLNHPQFLSTDDFFMAIAKMRSFNTLRVNQSIVGQNKGQSTIRERFKKY